jgi:4-methylaminobutanoate oxidase (formaldehyde-forming)
MEKAYRDYGHDIDNTDGPLEAGLGFALKLDKPGGFIGRDAVVAHKERHAADGGMTRRLVQVRLRDPDPLLYGAEVVLRDGVAVGYVRAASYGWTLGAAVGLAQVSGDGERVTKDWLAAGRWEVDVAGNRHAAEVSLRPMYDPTSARVRV